MKPFNFHIPTRIIFGKRKIESLNEKMPSSVKRVLIVTDEGLYQNTDLPKKVGALLKNRTVTTYFKIQENPSFQSVNQAVAVADEFKAHRIIGLGGGSAMDAAKYVANQLKKPIPIICIPSTSGTGSEVTPFAVLTDPNKETKEGISDLNYFPELSIIDPELTYSMPPQVTLNTGLDVLAHSAEAFLSTESSAMSDLLALESIQLVINNLPRAIKKETKAMDNMAYAAMLGGVAITHASTILPHIMGYPLTVYHQVPHGRAGIIMLPAFLDFLEEQHAIPEKTEKLAEIFKPSGGIKDFLNRLGVSIRLRDYGVKEDELANFTHKTIIKGDVAITPGQIDEQCILDLYHRSF